jgi:hypothetical protein
LIVLIVFWFQVGFGLFLILILIVLGIKYSKDKTKLVNDEKIIKIVEDELDKDGFSYFELQSITSMTEPNVTSVVVNTGYLEIAIEIDNDSGRIVSKERISR